MKQHSSSCVQNQAPILKIIKPLLQDKRTVLEVGSGTGQHAVFFAQQMPHLNWQASDQSQYLPSVNAWIDEANLDNLPSAIELDVTQPWPELKVDSIFSANTTHIMSWEMVINFFQGIRLTLETGGLFILYGPFNYNAQYTSQSNANFDLWLKDKDAQSAIRDFEALNALAKHADLHLINDYEMPANNRILVWEKA
ncbi:MAG: methylase [Candidatus Thioglobus sp.]|nr:MAG: methylase [Candidatus Thioglobus sp.]RUM77339.1 MAG: methylase [Candidatus Thioglobus sp.]RUM81522.1 MAG: methylase [Candidatus Thioglobus sp.]